MTDSNDSSASGEVKRGRARAARAAGAAAKAARAAGGIRKKAAVAPRADAGTAKAIAAPVTGPAEGGTMKIKEFTTRVLARAGATRAAGKPVIDAVLAELGESLARGESFALPPLGRGKVRPAKDGAKADAALTLKIKQGGGKKASAAAGDDAE